MLTTNCPPPALPLLKLNQVKYDKSKFDKLFEIKIKQHSHCGGHSNKGSPGKITEVQQHDVMFLNVKKGLSKHCVYLLYLHIYLDTMCSYKTVSNIII